MDDKQRLLDEGGYLVASNDLMRKVMPMFIRREGAGKNDKDAFILYFYLSSYVDGRKVFKQSGNPNPRYGYAYPSVKKIAGDTQIAKKRIPALCKMLVELGLLETKATIYNGKHVKWYKVKYAIGGASDDELDVLE